MVRRFVDEKIRRTKNDTLYGTGEVEVGDHPPSMLCHDITPLSLNEAVMGGILERA